jgi:nucleotide-binding universal stress UspA family protein
MAGEVSMKILLAVNNSACSIAAVREVAGRPWPAGSEVRVVSVAEMPLMLAPAARGAAPGIVSPELVSRVERVIMENARVAINTALLELEDKLELRVATKIIKGSPARSIVDEAERWSAALIVVGSCGDRYWHKLFRASASLAVAKYAKCSVEIVKFVKTDKEAGRQREVAEKEVFHAVSYSC